MERSQIPAEFTTNTGPPATEKQVKFMTSLLNERELPAKGEATGADRRADALAKLDAGQITKFQAMKIIKWLLTLPKRANNPANPVGKIHVEYEEQTLDDGEKHRIGYVVGAGKHRVPRGRYALDTGGAVHFKNDTTFFKLWVGTRGGWKLSVQVSDEEYPIDSWDTKRWVIEQIAADPESAMRLYGHELGKCGMCGRTLTNDESRALGIGPVCRTRL
jgi:hypothetical protein